MSKVIVVVGCAILAACSCGMGMLASWVLGYFSVHVPWYVCSVALFILGSIFGAGRSP